MRSHRCSGLTSVAIPIASPAIGRGAFASCTSLTNVTIGDSVTNIGDYAFMHCTGLTNVTIPNSVTSIGNCAFYACTSLTSVTIPNSVTSIGTGRSNCTSLTTITVDAVNAAYSSLDGVLFDKSTDHPHPMSRRKAGSYTDPGSVTTIGRRSPTAPA